MASAMPGDRGAEERTAKMQALRGLLAEKFPEQELKDTGLLPTGLAAFDAAEGGLRRGAVTELVAATSGGALFIEVMLAALGRQQGFGALVDLGGSFDPQAHPAGCSRGCCGSAAGRPCRRSRRLTFYCAMATSR